MGDMACSQRLVEKFNVSLAASLVSNGLEDSIQSTTLQKRNRPNDLREKSNYNLTVGCRKNLRKGFVDQLIESTRG